MILPLLIGGVCIITSIIGTYMVRLGAKGSIMGALYKGFWTATIARHPGDLWRRSGMRSAVTSTQIGASTLRPAA